MTTYLGYDVLDYVKHNRADVPAEGLEWGFDTEDNGTGKTYVEDVSGSPVPVRNFSWFMESRSDIADLKAFMDARLGMLNPFWVSSMNADLELAQDVVSGNTEIIIKDVKYTDFYFPQTARHHLALTYPDGTMILKKVTAAQSNGDGTETLTLDSALSLPSTLSASSATVSFLLFCRLATDTVQIMWHTNESAECQLQFIELPREVPA